MGFVRSLACPAGLAGLSAGFSNNAIADEVSSTGSPNRGEKGMIAFGSSVFTWDEKTLDAFIRRPKKVVEGTTMPYRSIRDPEDRKDLIAYLKPL